ncbi:hypothetical protein G7Y89_g2762 [Cudoniella acicularis]|uniref:Uncharacterized protein n=1 Tax=Cudoniella acicularis TaxID=354080 RepID=A0A8H4RTZ0_9HELO|nr:hypothetical protein G7Y89_g2762 [Cudoniella acicularis]
MGEFHDAVSTLLDAFARGISIIKTQSQHGKDRSRTRITADSQLSRSLKNNRAEVKNAYTESRSSLSTILSRLSTGFLSVIDRFSRGKSTPSDYQSLMSLSDLTRREAIHTFEQLSIRLSTSSLALAPLAAPADKRSTSRKKESTTHRNHTRAKSTPNLSVTPLGPATPNGWVRSKSPKKSRKSSSKSKSTTSMNRKREEHAIAPPHPRPKRITAPEPTLTLSSSPSPPQRAEHALASPRDNRISFMSFASDSTKLGEIPERKWAKPAGFDYGSGNSPFPITAYYPLEPYQEPGVVLLEVLRFR